MSGYIGTQPVPQATQTRQSFTATASQTTFATVGYTPGFLDVYLNGVHLLNGTDYTATNGSDVVLTTGAAASDVLEVISYSTYEVNSQNYTGGLTVDNDGATVLTVDRATDDGTIIDFQKDGSSVGSVGSKDSNLFIGTGDTGVRFSSGTNSVFPIDTSTGNGRDAAVDLGLGAGGRFKNLYLSGGVYLGGTGAANYLDDYEEGTFTPVIIGTSTSGTGTYTSQRGSYIKIGKMVYAQIYLAWSSHTGTGDMRVDGLPFTSASALTNGYGTVTASYLNGLTFSRTQVGGYVSAGANQAAFSQFDSGVLSAVPMDTSVTEVLISVTYKAA